MRPVATVVAEPLSYAKPMPTSASSVEPQRRPGIRILVWSVGIVVIVGMGIAVLLPSLCRPRETANRIKCQSNLRQIGQAIALYAKDNGGQYPPSLATLAQQQQLSAEMMICPSSNDERSPAIDTAGVVADLMAAETDAVGRKHCLSYVHAGRDLNTATVLPMAVVAYEPLDNHDGTGTDVLFGDGHVEFADKKSWSNMATAAGVALVPSLKGDR